MVDKEDFDEYLPPEERPSYETRKELLAILDDARERASAEGRKSGITLVKGELVKRGYLTSHGFVHGEVLDDEGYEQWFESKAENFEKRDKVP